jgi:hypothetical protein
MRIPTTALVRGLAAVVAVMLVAGTAFALEQAGSPNGVGAGFNAPGKSKPAKAAKASHEPEASEAPDASEAPQAGSDESGAAPSADELARLVDRLKAAGITTDAAALGDLASKVGVGGAVRVLAFAHASGKTPAEILAMFQSGKGWGQIDQELGLSIGPGIGWIMGHGGGHN